LIRLTDHGRQAAPVIETMGRSVPSWSPRATSRVSVIDRETGDVAPLIPVDVYARKITRAEEAEARAKGRRSTTPSWRSLATRRGIQ